MSWFIANLGLIWQLTLDHIALSVPPIVLGFALSLPIGWLANRRRLARGGILSVGGILYAIPSLPLFVLMPALIGTKILDPVNVVIALTIYALALMVRTSADALASVDRDVLQSSTAVGYSAWQRFWAVELPLAGGPLLAGLRVVSVSTVSLVSVGAVVGVNSLGYLFLDGFNRYFPEEILVGIIGSVIIALVFDGILVLIGRLLMPWTARTTPRWSRGRAVSALAHGA
ncbi:ABC transporter permease subunit [Microbacterium sp. STN6]|uniref:ABC transporter permease n=1 Tax=Microbacterium sp. STN6 TaxID=2995588 RepID=UPI002260B9F7|nr:ABC transporter permease subunit [Microbacterium sp. STN6]MCX7522286.1 ABC transporter permease subunit [Microbacterium sp. STN6]